MAILKKSTAKKRALKSSRPQRTKAEATAQRERQAARRNGKEKTKRLAKPSRPSLPTYWISKRAHVNAVWHALGNKESVTETVRTGFAEYVERHAEEVKCAVLLKARALPPESSKRMLEKGWTAVSLGLDRWTRARAIALAAAKKLTLNELVDQAVLESLPL